MQYNMYEVHAARAVHYGEEFAEDMVAPPHRRLVFCAMHAALHAALEKRIEQDVAVPLNSRMLLLLQIASHSGLFLKSFDSGFQI